MSATDSGLPLIAHRYVPPGNNPFEALHNLITFSSRDFGADRTDAWLYGIVVGWDNEDTDPDPEDLGAMDELAATFGWDAQTVAQLRELRSQWIQRTTTPVVPAPTETEWPSLNDVPAEVVKVRDREGFTYRQVSQGRWEGQATQGQWATVNNPAHFDYCAPFVAVEADQ